MWVRVPLLPLLSNHLGRRDEPAGSDLELSERAPTVPWPSTPPTSKRRPAGDDRTTPAAAPRESGLLRRTVRGSEGDREPRAISVVVGCVCRLRRSSAHKPCAGTP